MRLPSLTFRAALLPVIALLLGTQSQAHFIWISLRGEAQRSLVMHFSEGRLDDTAPYLNSNLERAQVFTANGRPLGMTAGRSGYSTELPAPMGLAGGHLVYGIFGRSGPPALLTYDAKAARTLADAGRRLGLTAEVLAHQEGDQLILTVLHDGAPLPGAEVKVVDDGSSTGRTLTTGPDGTARCPMPISTVFACRALVTGDTTGEHEGKTYERTLRYTTLCIERVRAASIPERSDPDAWLALESALLREHRLPQSVHGVKGTVTVMVAGERHAASFVQLSGEVEVFEAPDLPTPHLAWARAALDDALGVVHQRPALDHQTATVLTRLPEGTSPLGVTVENEHGSRVTIRDHLVQEIRTRTTAGTHVRTILERTELDGGRSLPSSELRVRMGTGGELQASATVIRTFQQVEETYLPDRYQELEVGPKATSKRELRFGALEVIR